MSASEPNQGPSTALSWIVTLLASGYIAFSAFALSRKIPAFAQTFGALGADIPLVTRVVLTLGTPAVLWPFASVLVVLLIAKELVIRSLGTRVLISVAAVMSVALISALAVEAIFEPMLQLIRQIG